MMKAMVQQRYGSPDEVLQLREVPRPAVREDEVLVRVRAASVHPDVWHVVAGRPYLLRLMGSGLRRPRQPVPGTDLAGQVEAVGRAVTRFKPGDEVFGESHPKLQWVNGGAFAEYAAAPQDALAIKPEAVSFEQAATVPTSGYIALNNLQHEGRLRSGMRVLINGAAGGVGSLAVQIARARGARVTGVDCAEKLELVRGLGADEVIDYAREDFTRSAERYDLILDVASTLSFAACRRVLTAEGTYVLIGHDHFGAVGSRALGGLPRFFWNMARSPFYRQLPRLSVSIPGKRETMAALKELLEAGALTPVVDRTFPLSEVPAALRYLQQGRARGRIVITP